MMRRRGRGVIGVAATTAVVAGTAGRVAHRQQTKYAAEDAAAAQAAAPAAEAPAAEPAYMAELEQLAQLKTQGIISEEEFQAKKAQILGI